MFVVVIQRFEGGILEANGPYEKYEQALWFLENCVPNAWKDYSEIKTLVTPEYEGENNGNF